MRKRGQKGELVEGLSAKLRGTRCTILTDYRGLNVGEMTDLRRALGQVGAEYRVVKNTLTRLAARQCGLEELERFLEGPTAIAFAVEDPVAPARLLAGFAREHAELAVKGGVLDGKIIDAAGIAALAETPPREVLLGRLAGLLNSPVSSLVRLLQASVYRFAYALEAICRQREQAVGTR